MVLASMIITDEDSLVCDMAETYRVYDYRSLPLKTAATFACGLRPDSRIMMKLSGLNVSLDTYLSALTVDSVRALVWQNTKDGQRGRNQPKSIAQLLLGKGDEKEIETYASPEDFEAAWRERTGK